MKINNVEVKGNGEMARVKTPSMWLEGRLFSVKPGTWDLMLSDGSGKTERLVDADIRDFSLVK